MTGHTFLFTVLVVNSERTHIFIYNTVQHTLGVVRKYQVMWNSRERWTKVSVLIIQIIKISLMINGSKINFEILKTDILWPIKLWMFELLNFTQCTVVHNIIMITNKAATHHVILCNRE